MSNSSSVSEVNKTFLYKYFHKGSWWTVEIPASDRDDAQARINKLPLAQPVGELVVKLPASGGMIARCLCWLRNTWVSVRQSR
jgi:hypothetical protein